MRILIEILFLNCSSGCETILKFYLTQIYKKLNKQNKTKIKTTHKQKQTDKNNLET